MQLDRQRASIPRMGAPFVECAGANFGVGSSVGQWEVPHQLVAFYALKAGKVCLLGARFADPTDLIASFSLRVGKSDGLANFELRADLDDHRAAAADVHSVHIFVKRFSRRLGPEDSNVYTNQLTRLSAGYHNRTPISAK